MKTILLKFFILIGTIYNIINEHWYVLIRMSSKQKKLFFGNNDECVIMYLYSYILNEKI